MNISVSHPFFERMVACILANASRDAEARAIYDQITVERAQAAAARAAGRSNSLGPLALSSAASVELDQLGVTSNTYWE
jgi:hypothetical protein